MRREGRDFKALCPWHDDTRPSLQVNPERQSFKCWVCDIGGDIFSFVMKMEGVEFPEALAMLADRANIRLQPARPARPPAPVDDKRLLYQAMAWAEDSITSACSTTRGGRGAATIWPSARSRPRASAVSTGLCARRLETGSSSRPAARRTRGPMLERVGLVSRPQERPGLLRPLQGPGAVSDLRRARPGGGPRRPRAAGTGRPTPAKYVNSPETPLFSKSKCSTGSTWPATPIRKTGTALVMEGYTDCIVAHQFGFENAVAVLGTALGEAHMQLLRRFADRIRVVLVLDGDEAGRSGPTKCWSCSWPATSTCAF